MSACSSPSCEAGDAIPRSTRLAQWSSCWREKPVSFSRRQDCTALLLLALTGASRVMSASRAFNRTSALPALLFLCLSERVQAAEPMGPKDSKAFFSCILRKPLQPLISPLPLLPSSLLAIRLTTY